MTVAGTLDRIAVVVGVWALRRLYGADCETYVSDEFPNECISCHATVLAKSMKEIF